MSRANTSALWRMHEQLRGLLRNHEDITAHVVNLAPPKTVLSSTGLALHPSEDALAVVCNPLMGSGSVGVMPTGLPSSGLDGAATMRWLRFDEDQQVCVDVEWMSDDTLLLGSSGGRVHLTKMPVRGWQESSGLLHLHGTLLTESDGACKLSDIVVPPNSPSASTFVHSLHRNPVTSSHSTATHVVGAKNTAVYLWDVQSSRLPIRQWLPHCDMDEVTPILFTAWAPGSESVVLSGSYDGSVILADTRKDDSNALALGLRGGFRGGATSACCGDFNSILPHMVAAGFSDGTFSLYDVRQPAHTLYTVASLQGALTSLQWLKLHADMILTSGVDGSVSLWNMRFPPTFCVGRAQYSACVSCLRTTRTISPSVGYGIGVTGELSVTGLRQTPTMALFSASADTSSSSSCMRFHYDENSSMCSSNNNSHVYSMQNSFSTSKLFDDVHSESDRLDAMEQRAWELLYTCQMKESYHLFARVVVKRYAAKNYPSALRLACQVLDVLCIALPDYNQLFTSAPSTPRNKSNSPTTTTTKTTTCTANNTLNHADNLSLEDHQYRKSTAHTRADFEFMLSQTALHLSTTLPVHAIRNVSLPDAQDMHQLDTVRLNGLLRIIPEEHVSLEATKHTLFQSLTAMSNSYSDSGGLSNIDTDALAALVRRLVGRNNNDEDAAAGEELLRVMLSSLRLSGQSEPVARLVRLTLNTAQEPKWTDWPAPGAASNLLMDTASAAQKEDRFYRDLDSAESAVFTQLRISRLGANGRFGEVVDVVNRYQRECIQRGQSGVFDWLAIHPLLLYLRCLKAKSEYVSFFWACSQCMTTWAQFPPVSHVESLLESVLQRIGDVTREHLNFLRDGQSVVAPRVNDHADEDANNRERADGDALHKSSSPSPWTLRHAYKYVESLIQIQLECENVALENHMDAMPATMRRVLDTLNTTSEQILESWASMLDSLHVGELSEVSRAYVARATEEFALHAENLVNISAKGEEDERLKAILGACDDFMQKLP